MAVWAVGDLQGCYDEFRHLLDQIEFDPTEDRLWLAGDLVNRGPKSLKTLRYIYDIRDSVTTVLGNHDLHLLAIVHGSAKARKGDTLNSILSASDCDELAHWLAYQPLMHRDKKLGYAMVHAGLPPQWKLKHALSYAREVEAVLQSDEIGDFFTQMYGNRPDLWKDKLQGWDRLRFIVNALTRLRYCSKDGRLALGYKSKPGSQPSRYVPWFRVPGRMSANKRIIFGHWSTLGLVSDPNVFHLDTGCVWGGRLTALRLDGEPLFASIPCPGAREPG